jgi:hypothetical protein
VNHDGKNVNHPDDLAQNECETLQQKNQAYMGNDHHDEDVGCNHFQRSKEDCEIKHLKED